MSVDPRMAGLPPAVVALVHAGARALRDGQPRHAEPLLLQACTQAPMHPEPLRYLAIQRKRVFFIAFSNGAQAGS